jgi:hypothetical protein
MAKSQEHPRSITIPSAILGDQIGDRAWRCRLPNGYETVAVLSRKWAADLPPVTSGQRVTVAVSPADFAQARIVAVDQS